MTKPKSSLKESARTAPAKSGTEPPPDLKATQLYTNVSIRLLKEIHAATHPGAHLEHDAENLQRAALLATLDSEVSRMRNSPRPAQKPFPVRSIKRRISS